MTVGDGVVVTLSSVVVVAWLSVAVFVVVVVVVVGMKGSESHGGLGWK